MRISFFIHTPAQVHFWAPAINELKHNGHEIFLVVRGEENIYSLMDRYNLHFTTYGTVSKTRYGKTLQLPSHFIKALQLVRDFRPDILVGAGTIEANIAFILRKPCIIFDDTEAVPFIERLSWRYIASAILTPESYKKDLGKKQVRFAGYKELAYLHPTCFTPDPTILNELGVKPGEKYVILRFNIFDAVHDIGRHGFTTEDQLNLVKELGKYARVFISPEGILAKDLENYRLPIAYDRIHQALFYAQMLVSDTGTMTTEAAILGTPGIMCLSNAGQFGNFTELEQKYDLIYSFREPDQAIQKAVELIQQPDLKEQWAIKRRKLLADKIDVTQFMVDFIENYPESFSKYKR